MIHRTDIARTVEAVETSTRRKLSTAIKKSIPETSECISKRARRGWNANFYKSQTVLLKRVDIEANSFATSFAGIM